jgi:hypothetical protein
MRFRITYERFFHGKQTVKQRDILDLGWSEEMMTNWYVDQRFIPVEKRNLSAKLEKTLKKNKISPNDKTAIKRLTYKLINQFFTQLEKELLENDYVYYSPVKLYCMFFANRTKMNVSTYQKVHFYMYMILHRNKERLRYRYSQYNHRIDDTKELVKDITNIKKTGRKFLNFQDFSTYIKGELKYDRQLKVYRPGGYRLRTLSFKQK